MTAKKTIVWSLPPADGGALGVAARTAFYPSLALDGAGYRSVFRRKAVPELLKGCHAQVLVVVEPPGERHREFLAVAGEAGRPTTVLLWYDKQGGEISRLVDGFDPQLIKLADPFADECCIETGLHTAPVPVLPASVLENELIARFTTKTASEFQPGDENIPASPFATCLVGGPRDLELIAPAMQRSSARSGLRYVIVTPDPKTIAPLVKTLNLPAEIVAESDSKWLRLIGNGCAALVSACTRDDKDAASLRAAIWSLTAMRAGVPVVTHSHPLLQPYLSGTIVDDWERAIGLHSAGIWLSTVDRALSLAKVSENTSAEAVKHAWQPLLSAARTTSPPRPASPEKPLLVVLVDLVQDIDILLPILLAIRRQDRLAMHIIVTGWLRDESPRTLAELTREGLAFTVIPRKNLLSPAMRLPDGAHGLLTASETSLTPHLFGHTLTKLANDSGLTTFTIQHGFENVGLTYADPLHGAEVRFGSRYVFIWCAPSNLPNWVSAETRARVIPTGNPKPTPLPVKSAKLPVSGKWTRIIGVFENLHWHRYSDAYKRDLQEHLATIIREYSTFLFLFKPHNAGRWLVANPAFLPRKPNVVLIDPLDPVWEFFTAPPMIPALDGIITTPSTVAVDAARAGQPVAVIGNDLDLPIYEPLPILRSLADWQKFLSALADPTSFLTNNEIFLRRNFLPGSSDRKIAAKIHDILQDRLAHRQSGATHETRSADVA